MDSRREFLKKAALLSGATGIFSLPASIQKALAINPEPGTTFMDAEHVVFLMQENRSFDHCYGSLQGVRGFNDPRAIRLPNNNPVWLQANAKGETYAPFRLNMKESKITWMGSLPHTWSDQVDARNNGKYDQWLNVKQSGEDEYKSMPLTMGYYTREDIPFYYALADAFTVCDQHFCSSLTGTTPNRLYFWTGAIREKQNEHSQANVWNEEVDYYSAANWKTFPERLEENNVSWKIYQNDISVDGGFTAEEDEWMANFGDNPIEYFTQFNVKLSKRYISFLQKAEISLPKEIEALEKQVTSSVTADASLEDLKKQLSWKKETLKRVLEDKKTYTKEIYEQLSEKEKSLHEKAFANNSGNENFYQLSTLKYDDNGIEREITIPKGDILQNLRQDVQSGKLPTVSWVVAPQNFSDHPSSAWFGAWYVSEVLDILTQNPEVWKKTIFVLTYDENDGYFDHVPPFVAPHPHKEGTGKVSDGIDISTEFVTMEQENKRTKITSDGWRESSIGLGYRVPLVIASPWSRGGWVNSEVLDHTSSLQFLEKLLSKKTAKNIREENISNWRRTICGDLTSVFRPYSGEKIMQPQFIKKDPFIETVHKAKFKEVPSGYKILSAQEIAQATQNPHSTPFMPKQENGIRSSCALPYELYVDGKLSDDKKSFEIIFQAKNTFFKDRASGAPFTVYAPGKYKNESMRVWSYGVAAGSAIRDKWPINGFENGNYHLHIHGPNGFFRAFSGSSNDPHLDIAATRQTETAGNNNATDNIVLTVTNKSTDTYNLEISDNAYHTGVHEISVDSKNTTASIVLDLSKNYDWYDFTVKIKGDSVFEKRYAGRVETGKPGFTDPAMGMVI